ncbi:Gfo/Idh/MocA family protein [Cohnella hashimotonis]|uniref:Gfo/Idh/MocA family oxidoreductase n=1 Tax=Cohnella hashimotonis TaxID=2826895 RepID=A0ABT6TS55_9BACL|nr:Gfo/Idh/MocA family oxidoreductase [Cohnella hashimotonis]
MKTYVIAGAGSRSLYMFAKPMASEWSDLIKLAGVYDKNPVRAELLSKACGHIPVYRTFQDMLAQTKPDVVLVATADHTHHTYIIEALRAGCDVISEKPMTIDEDKCRAILQAEKDSGRKVTVTFNLRFSPYFAQVKQLIADGAIGDVYHMQLEWFLDRRHGADYFRRWHSEMKNSGGLLVHKSTHHFDIANWWIDSAPAEVHAFGSRRVYGDRRANKGDRCLTCDFKQSCEFYLDAEQDPFLKQYYLQAEQEDGYIRDRCVFDDRIDIYDNMSVNVRYKSGALLTYSLIAYSPYEGWRASINGSQGRLELANVYRNADMSPGDSNWIKLIRNDGTVENIEVRVSAEGHGGGDAKLRKALFEGNLADPLGQQAGSLAGAQSLLIGALANRSIAEGRSLPFPCPGDWMS